MIIKFSFPGADPSCKVFSMLQDGCRVPAKLIFMIPEKGKI
jgi:hypothetical protein